MLAQLLQPPRATTSPGRGLCSPVTSISLVCSATAAGDQHVNPHIPKSVPMEGRDCQELCKKNSGETFPSWKFNVQPRSTPGFLNLNVFFRKKNDLSSPTRDPAQHSKYLGAVDFLHGMQKGCPVFIWLLSELELSPGCTEENGTAVSQDGQFHGCKNCGNKALMDQTGSQHNFSLPNKGNVPRFLHQEQFELA